MRAALRQCRLLKGCARGESSIAERTPTIADPGPGCAPAGGRLLDRAARVPDAAEDGEGVARQRLPDHFSACLDAAVHARGELLGLLARGAARDHEVPAADDAVPLGLELLGELPRLVPRRRLHPYLPGRV